MHNHKTKSKQLIKVSGYWVIRVPKGKAPITYYVEPYSYKRKSTKGIKHKKHLPIRAYPKKKFPPVPKGYVLDKHYDIEPPMFDPEEDRFRYTYKIEALVEYQGRYLMSFSLDKDLKGQKAIEYYHTKFEPTIEKATVNFHGEMAILRAYGHVIQFLSIDLYRVSGVGTLREKHWKLLKSYNEPEDVK